VFLVGANVPGDAKEGELSSVLAAPAPAAKPAPAAAPARAAQPAAAPRVAASTTAYPRCSGAVQDRCIQGRSAAPVPQRRVQLASRAGERG
jgi:uncharacterized membrane protein